MEATCFHLLSSLFYHAFFFCASFAHLGTQSIAYANAKHCMCQRKALHLPTQSFASAHANVCLKRRLHLGIPSPCFPLTLLPPQNMCVRKRGNMYKKTQGHVLSNSATCLDKRNSVSGSLHRGVFSGVNGQDSSLVLKLLHQQAIASINKLILLIKVIDKRLPVTEIAVQFGICIIESSKNRSIPP